MSNNLRLKLLTADEVGTIYDKCLDFLSSKGVEVDHPQNKNHGRQRNARVHDPGRTGNYLSRLVQSFPAAPGARCR